MIVSVTPNWEPLEQRLAALGESSVISSFMWMYSDSEKGVEYYKHRETRRYLLLARDGRCLRRTSNDGLVQAEFADELRAALPKGGD